VRSVREISTRLGELLALPHVEVDVAFGRGAAGADDTFERITLRRERPGSRENAAPLRNPFLSRTQLKLRASADGVHVENVGKRTIAIDGDVASEGTVRVGGTLLIKGMILFQCVRRPAMHALTVPLPMHPFGEADAVGIVGESPAVWMLREQVAFAAARAPHVLLLGQSGTGKELVAQALHRLSPRGKRAMVARNAATFPSGLIDAELFGNVAGYPNPGMPERPGVVGEADGSTLFLDEIGELSSELQAHLLRFLDERGEYQRLGDARRRSADVRVVAATNRPASELKHDLAARLQIRIDVPSLDDRPEDVPLLARHLLRKIAARDGAIADRFFAGGEPRVSASLVRALLSHRHATNVRGLEALLWCALSTSRGGDVDATDEVLAMVDEATERTATTTRREVTTEEIAAAMEKHRGVHEKVWRELGLPNRHVLQRLLKKPASRPRTD
jgi:DNA-binding NtrC family response regulator